MDEVTVESLSAMLSASAAAAPGRPALVFRNRPISYAELHEWVRRCSAALHTLGVRKGDRVALLVGNIPEFLYAFYGTVALGAVAVPLDVSLTAEELGSILADCEARVVTTQVDHLPAVLAIRDRSSSIEHVLMVGPPPTPGGAVSLDELLDVSTADEPTIETIETSKQDLAVITYTKGTTEEPRGAMLTHGNLLANVRQVLGVPALKLEGTDIVLMALPLSSLLAFNVVLGGALSEGATVLLVERFDPEETLDLVEKHGATGLFGTPAMLRSLLEAGETRDVARSSIRLAVSTPIPKRSEILETFRRRFGGSIWEWYGPSEGAPVLATTALGPTTKMNSIGLPLSELEVRLVDENGEDVEDGDLGEIVVRGPSVWKGYWNAPDETEAMFMDEWFRTGDLAYRDDEGFLFLVGRTRDVIRVSGFNVFPGEVEDVLSRHSKVLACTVLGVPDESTGEAVKARVTLKPGETATEEELVEYCGTVLARFKCPAIVEFVQPA